MMFVGFGYLMTFLKAYGLGAVGFTMYITCLGVEFAIIIESFMGKGSLTIDFMSLLNGNFAVAAVLISFGGLIGKISPVQCTVVTVVELTCYCVNKVYFLKQYDESPLIADCGGTIIIHVFGAYFGLMACTILGPPAKDDLNGSSYSSGQFSLIGTVFLWLFWPSFVAGALPSGAGQTTALINTVLALLASTMTTFGLTPLLDAGLLSTWGFIKTPLFSTVDTCGIHNLHGMPGIFGGLVSIVVPFLYADTGMDAFMQCLGLVITLAFACATGAGTGNLLKLLAPTADPFSDAAFWGCADDIAKAGGLEKPLI